MFAEVEIAVVLGVEVVAVFDMSVEAVVVVVAAAVGIVVVVVPVVDDIVAP